MHFHSKKTNKKKTKKKYKKREKKTKKKRQKKNKKKRQKKKKMQRYVCVSYLTPSFFLLLFVVGFISGGLSEIFLRDELSESSLRSFVPWIMTDMYMI